MARDDTWPVQAACDAFYGDPRGSGDQPSSRWESENLILVSAPYRMTYDGRPIRGVRIHRRCAASLRRVFDSIWEAAGRDQSVVDKWGASIFAGSYVYRVKRGGNTLSMHAYGCALDLDPARNAFHDTTPNFANVPQVVKAFEDEGWTWGGRWRGRACDGMHFQAAYVSEAARNLARPAKPRIIPPAPRVDIDAKALRKAGSRTIAGIDEAKSGAIGAAITAAAPAAAVLTEAPAALKQAQDAMATAKQTAETVAQAKDGVVALSKSTTWLADHWIVVMAAVCALLFFFFVWRVWRGVSKAEAARVDDARTGVNGRRC